MPAPVAPELDQTSICFLYEAAMTQNGNSRDFPNTSSKKQASKGLGLLPLHEAALKLAGMGLNRSHSKTRDLVAMLLGHGARAWRGGQPYVELHLHVKTPQGRHPVRLRLR
jgi:hypothetical protein